MTNNKKSLEKINKQDLTNRDLYFFLLDFFKENNLDFGKSEAELILIAINNYTSKTDLYLNFEKNPAELNYFNRILKQLSKHINLEYILGSTKFLDFDIKLQKGVLIPRPETEELVIKTISYIKNKNLNHNNIGDICSGTGCIIKAMANEFQTSNCYAVEKFKKALKCLKTNAIEENITIFEGDKIKPFIENNIKLDVLISNPPYVENKKDIEEYVLNNEPLNAIYCKKGTYFYEFFIKNRKKFMSNKYFMAFEINYDQEEKLANFINKLNDNNLYYWFEKDLYGLTRFLFILGGYL